jgi:hypothetical protein
MAINNDDMWTICEECGGEVLVYKIYDVYGIKLCPACYRLYKDGKL